MKRIRIVIALLAIASIAYSANELTSQIQTTFSKNGVTYTLSLQKVSDVSGDYAADVIYAVTTNGTAVSWGAAQPIGAVVIQNMTTNTGYVVYYGTNSASFYGMVNPGENAMFRPYDGTNFWLQAAAAASNGCNVRVFGVSR